MVLGLAFLKPPVALGPLRPKVKAVHSVAPSDPKGSQSRIEGWGAGSGSALPCCDWVSIAGRAFGWQTAVTWM